MRGSLVHIFPPTLAGPLTSVHHTPCGHLITVIGHMLVGYCMFKYKCYRWRDM